MKRRERLEHRFIDGEPVGLQTTVEHLKYVGNESSGKPVYELSATEKWKSAAVITWVGIALYAAWSWSQGVN